MSKNLKNQNIHFETQKSNKTEDKKASFGRISFNSIPSFSTIADMIQNLSKDLSVNVFEINCNNINASAANLIVNFLKNRKNIEQIILWEVDYYSKHGNLRFEILNILTELLNNKYSVEINSFRIFSGQLMGLEGTKILADNLINNNYLKWLDIPCAMVTDEGARIILKALTLSKVIKQINLANNKLSDESSLYFEQFLKDNQSIQNFNLSANEITKVGFKILTQGLVENYSLTKLDLTKNNLTYKDENFLLLTTSVVARLKINSYIKTIIENLNDLAITISDDQKYAKELELANAYKLRNYLDNNLSALYLQGFDDKIKYYALKITPTPLKIILAAPKFLDVMNLYISTCLEKTIFLEQEEAIIQTIKLFKSTQPAHKLCSIHQFIESVEATSSNLLALKKRRLSISIKLILNILIILLKILT